MMFVQEAIPYADSIGWQNWQKDFQYGTLVFLPTGDVRQVADSLRNRFDPSSAKTCAAHVTITQPFTKAPNQHEITQLEKIVSSIGSIQIQLGPATTSPNQKLVWLDVSEKEKILFLRQRLHELGLFRTDLPLTKGFIPHLTISEAQRKPSEVSMMLKDLNSEYSPWNVQMSCVSWIIPNQDFVFQEYRQFPLLGEK